MQAGWYKKVQVKSVDFHEIRALLNSRVLLVKIKRDLSNLIRGTLKNLGLIVGKAYGYVFHRRAGAQAMEAWAPKLTVIVVLTMLLTNGKARRFARYCGEWQQACRPMQRRLFRRRTDGLSPVPSLSMRMGA